VFAALDILGGAVRVFEPNGTFVTSLDTGMSSFHTGMAFDQNRNLYVTGFSDGRVVSFNPTGTLLGTFGSASGLPRPESLVFNDAGELFVGQAGSNQINRYSATGTLLNQYTVQIENVGTDWIDLAADQCTMYYTSEGRRIFRYNVCTSTQLSDFVTTLPNANAFALRIRPNGEVLVADRQTIVRLSPTGTILQQYDTPVPTDAEAWFALNLDPDGTSFWSGDFFTKNFYKFDIETGNILVGPISASPTSGSFLGGLAVCGEFTAATNNPPNAVDDVATTPIDTPITINVLANDTDADGDPLTITEVTQPAAGTGSATFTASNVTYTPPTGFTGNAVFTYTINDGRGGNDTANVTVTVGGTPPTPTVIAPTPQPVTPAPRSDIPGLTSGPVTLPSTGYPPLDAPYDPLMVVRIAILIVAAGAAIWFMRRTR
jgi:sugar lactone lactonase YvrE